MIIIGYQGIGKSSVAKEDYKYIDLESSNFWVDGNRPNDYWPKAYTQIAEDLSRQGYTVFTSSHAAIQASLANSVENVVVVFPSLDLKNEWIDRLRDRYISSGLSKDEKALFRAVDFFEEDINELKNYCRKNNKTSIEISSIKYDLAEILIRGY